MEVKEKSIKGFPQPVTQKWWVWHLEGNITSIFLKTETILYVYFLDKKECDVL